MTLRGPKAVVMMLAAFAVLVLIVLLEITDSSTFYAWQQARMVKRVLAAEPEELVSAGRALLASRAGFVGKISPASRDIPRDIRRLKPTRVFVSTNSLGVDFSDVFNPFGIIVYAAGANPPPPPKSGIGPRKWIDGLWLYHDGQLEGIGQPDGAANRSQPIRAETKRTSEAAGSDR